MAERRVSETTKGDGAFSGVAPLLVFLASLVFLLFLFGFITTLLTGRFWLSARLALLRVFLPLRITPLIGIRLPGRSGVLF
jgi:hypothetical protein